MDIRFLLALLVIGCGGPKPSAITTTPPYDVKWYEGPKDTAMALLLPDLFLPEGLWKPVIREFRRNRIRVAVISWNRGEDVGRFFRELELQGFDNIISDAISKEVPLPVIALVAQGEWTLLGKKMADSYDGCALVLMDGFFLAPSLEWNALGQGDTLSGQRFQREEGFAAWTARAQRIPFTQSRDSLFEGRSYAYWWAFESLVPTSSPPTKYGIWVISKNHPWLSASSTKLIQAFGPVYFSPHLNNQEAFYEETAKKVREVLSQH